MVNNGARKLYMVGPNKGYNFLASKSIKSRIVCRVLVALVAEVVVFKFVMMKLGTNVLEGRGRWDRWWNEYKCDPAI